MKYSKECKEEAVKLSDEIPDVSLANWEAADLCQNGELNVLDLCLMKRELLRSVQYSLPESPEKS